MSATRENLLSTEDVVRLAAATLVCLLALASMHRPDLAQERAVAAFAAAWVYSAWLLGRHLLRPSD